MNTASNWKLPCVLCNFTFPQTVKVSEIIDIHFHEISKQVFEFSW